MSRITFITAFSLLLYVSYGCKVTKSCDNLNYSREASVCCPSGASCNDISMAIVSGPMIGHVSMRSAKVWAQTNKKADICISYWVAGNADKSEGAKCSAWEVAQTSTAYSVNIELVGLDPGSKYEAVVVANGVAIGDTIEITTQTLWDYRMDPPAFKVALGSCAYINEVEYDRPGKTYGGEYEVFESIVEVNPDMMLWLGDNIYLREVDFQSYSGYLYRYSHMRATPEVQGLLKACPNYAIWDDHDYGPNDADMSWIHRDWAQEAFKTFWANPSYGAPSGADNVGTAFRFNDIDFFLLDNRSQRVHPNNRTQDVQVLGEEQLDWLIAALNKSRSPFKMVAVGGQLLNDVAKYENMANFPDRQEIIDRIEEEHIHGVVFLTGDRHCTNLSRLELEGGIVIHDLTVSPLTSSAYDNSEEPNTLRVDDTTFGERNFAELNFSGPRKDRSCNIVVRDAKGKEVWTKTLVAKEL